MSNIRRLREFAAPKAQKIVEFFALQGVSLVARLLFGFVCVRLLPIQEYAKFAVVFGFLGTLAVLMDIAFTTTLLPLVGERVQDVHLIADYLASLRQLSHRLYFIVAPAAALIFPIVVHRQQWNWKIVCGMVAILLVASWCDRVGGAYGAVLIVCRDRSFWYRVQMFANIGALLLLGVIWLVHGVNAFSAILINLCGIICVAAAYYLRAKKLLGVPGRASREKRDAIVHLASPSMPNVIFYAFQGQISLLLITIFGHAAGVASIGALARLGQIFLLFAQMNPLLIEPYFARLPEASVKRIYAAVMSLEGLFCLVVLAAVYYFPQIFLWVIGPQYSGLRHEVFLAMLISCIGHLCGVLWSIHSARRFVYWWNGVAVIAYSIIVEAICIWKLDLSTVRGVLEMNVLVGVGLLIIQSSTGLYGFIVGPRKTAPHVILMEEENAY